MKEPETIKELLAGMKIPQQYLVDLKQYPHVREFMCFVTKGRVKEAFVYREFFKDSFFYDLRQIRKARNKQANDRTKRMYGNNWSVQKNKYFLPALFKSQNGRCKECKNTFTSQQLTIDHIKRIAEGGKNEIENMQALCFDCHFRKDKEYGAKAGAKNGIYGTPWVSPPLH